MKGTKKQVSWAKDIKEAVEKMFNNFDIDGIKEKDKKMIEKIGDSKDWKSNYDRIQTIENYITKQEDSTFWISNFKEFNEMYQNRQGMDEDEQDWFKDRVVKSFVNSIWNCGYEGKKPSRKIKKYINIK